MKLKKIDKRLGNELVPKGIKITSLVEVTYQIKSDFKEFNREVKEYYLESGESLGSFDPLDQFSSIIDDASLDITSKDR
ncbi:hypothetical protein [uncultured Anaerococcus sp.]|uniref:hypothetical protein n=1 Tax=uncultured Anaerococcus sp. TaxID=293428 RepID=UPI00260A0C87|nr:hypothetical protein [uncultured Anaerococcus sp.]